MSDLERVGVALGITAWVLVLAWLSRRAALDMDERGYPGWIFGILIMFALPVGLLAWLWFRAPGPSEPR